jgi:hypothetical protein
MTNDEVSTSRLLWVALGGTLPIAVAAALVGLRDAMANANVALVLVLVVVLAAVGGGAAAGATAAVSAALSFNFFHTQPYNTLRIDSRDDVETMVLLLAVGLAVGQIVAAKARRAVHDHAGVSDELRRVHRVAVLGDPGRHTAEEMIMAAQHELTDLLALERCSFEAFPYGPALPRLGRSGVLSVMEYRPDGEGFALPADGAELPVLGRGNVLGRFVLVPREHTTVTLEQRMVAIAIADHVGAALSNRPSVSFDAQQGGIRHG